MEEWAVRGMDWRYSSGGKNNGERHWRDSVADWTYPTWNYWSLRVRLSLLSVGYYATRWMQQVMEFLTGRRQAGFEDVLDQQMRKCAFS